LPESSLSKEFRLVAACCEWPASSERDQRLKELAPGLDWGLTLQLARRHRIEGLVHRAFSEAGIQVPETERTALSKAAAAIGTQSLLQSAESARLQRLLGEQGIKCIFLKGVPLAMLAYGTLGVKQAWDIDLLVPPESAAAAIPVLQRAGYTREYPAVQDVPEERLLDWARVSKESLWKHERNGMVVELHTGLVDNPAMLPTLPAEANLQMVPIGSGIELATLGTDELFAYICVHGGAHAWARLKWLADVGALLRKAGPGELERLYRRSLELGAGRSSAQALLLCSRLLSLSLPDHLHSELKRDPTNGWLERLAISAMAGHGATELDDTVLGTIVIHASHFLLGRGWRYKYGEIARKAVNPEDRFSMPLPRYLHFIYPVAAVPRWVLRRYRMSRS
jgi:hypothetical protein